jgi:hypothetical protein
VHVCNCSSGDAEIGEFQVQGQPCYIKKSCFRKLKNEKEICGNLLLFISYFKKIFY